MHIPICLSLSYPSHFTQNTHRIVTVLEVLVEIRCKVDEASARTRCTVDSGTSTEALSDQLDRLVQRCAAIWNSARKQRGKMFDDGRWSEIGT